MSKAPDHDRSGAFALVPPAGEVVPALTCGRVTPAAVWPFLDTPVFPVVPRWIWACVWHGLRAALVSD